MFTFSRTNKPLCFAGKKVIYQKDGEIKCGKCNFNSYRDPSVNFSLIPTREEDQRDSIYVCGPSGAGKSTFARSYIINFKKMFPKRPIFIFSKIDQDKAYDDLPIKRIDLEDLVQDDIEDDENIYLEKLRDSLCVFDDIDQLTNKEVKKVVESIQSQILELGRHYNIYIVSLRHVMLDYKKTRTLLNEANKVVFFQGSKNNIIKQYLGRYCGFSSKEIAKITANKDRWKCINTGYPGYILTEHSIFIPSEDKDESKAIKHHKHKQRNDEFSDEYGSDSDF